MAARIHARHQEDVRAKIQGVHLIKFLQDYALGKHKGDVAKSRVTAALGLLKKVSPDLSATQLTGNLTLTHEQQLDQLK